MGKSNNPQLERERAVYRYLDALESGDIDGIIESLQQAIYEAPLDQMLVDAHQVYFQEEQAQPDELAEIEAQTTVSMPAVPLSLQSKKHKQKQRRRAPVWLQTLAAVLIVGALIGSFVALLAVHNTSNSAHSGKRTPTPTASSALQQMPEVVDMKMTSATIGWAIGLYTPTAISSRVVMRTVDGGKTWQIFPFSGQAAGLMGSFFLDDQTAWVTLGSSMDAHDQVTVAHTTDGGQHWTTLHLPPLMSNYTFLDQQHGWAWALEDGTTNVQEAYTLYKTVDGGTTWSKVGGISRTRSFSDPGPGLLPVNAGLSITFLTPQHGWAVLWPPDHLHVLLYMTQNGGVTWLLQSLPQPATGPIPGIQKPLSGASSFVNLEGPTFFTSQNGVLGIVSQDKGVHEIYLYATDNGGYSWSPLGAGFKEPDTLPPLIEVIDSTHLLLKDGIMVTTYVLVNGQWQKQHTWQPSGDLMCFSSIGQLGWVYVAHISGNETTLTLYTTRDGGISWHEVMQGIVEPSSSQQRG